MDIYRNRVHKGRRIIGLTGGIGMGKTTVSDYLANVHKLPVLDADLYAREAVEPGSTVLAEVAARYGSGILLPNGALNRHRLGDIIFTSLPERQWLEQQIHPHVRDRLAKAIKTPPLDDIKQSPVIVLVIPLLFEARMTDLVTETWVIRCSSEQQLERLMKRDRLTLEQAEARIASQMAIQKKIDRADVILDNSSTPENLLRQVDLKLAQQPDRLTMPQG